MTLELPVIARVAAALVVALLISFISTPVVKSIAQRVGAMDIPKDNRRMITTPSPGWVGWPFPGLSPQCADLCPYGPGQPGNAFWGRW